MPAKVESFLANVASTRAKSEAADADFVKTLKGLSPAEFARVPRAVLNELTNQHYADVVRAIAPDIELKQETTPPAVVRKKPKARLGFGWISRAVTAASCAIVFGLVAVMAVLEAPPAFERLSYSRAIQRSADVAGWPRCPRLTRWTDGCIYQVMKGLGWAEAARDLGLPEEALHDLNRQIHSDYIPSGANLIIWRYRFPLQEDSR